VKRKTIYRDSPRSYSKYIGDHADALAPRVVRNKPRSLFVCFLSNFSDKRTSANHRFIRILKAHTTNLAVVAPGIAEALLATALGLVAAILAVMIYNVLPRARCFSGAEGAKRKGCGPIRGDKFR
jgi:MotA/TolQ/ExbB proton channel family